ncbi:MerR family transcriptional regulator [Nonomuraea sp. SBT364]|uniref:MerR family transcriptional regulator n=1 Tax=Nonomuraea sp. SBT364 TaxID=1580530 RepID=UPI00066AF541|nr:MerR family transcriptional regulator [Nonomuraea sp. SBT364]
MWRIGQLARMTGVSERALRHYDKLGLLKPAATDRMTGYRWYGVPELSRLERIRALQRLGLPLRHIADLLAAPEAQVRQAVTENLASLRRDIATLTATAAHAEDHLATPMSILPQSATVGPRHLRVRHLTLHRPADLAVHCPDPPATLLTWLQSHPTGPFTAAVTTDGGTRLTLPARSVVRAVVPESTGVVRAGQELFGWLDRHGLDIIGPNTEEHLMDGDGARATLLEISVGPHPDRHRGRPEPSTDR